MTISGNRTLPFKFINDLLGIKPLSYYSATAIEQQITELYCLGYFESLTYEVEPVDEEWVRLHFQVKERSHEKLGLGLRYDDLYKLVALLSYQKNNFLRPGIRLESDLQFAGLVRFDAKLYYPSRTLDFPIYPFVRLAYKDIPINIFNTAGAKEALYHDRSTSYALGLGFLPLREGNFEIELGLEDMNTDPIIAATDTLYPQFSERLIQVIARYNLDRLDNVLLPRRGYLVQGSYENSSTDLGSDLEYWRANLEVSAYFPLDRRQTLKIGGSLVRSSATMPIYKYYYFGGPEDYIGTEYDQLIGDRMTILRLAYRYRQQRDVYLKLLWQTVFDFDFDFRFQDIFVHRKQLQSWGAGILFMSPFGPIEIIVSQGQKTTFASSPRKNRFFFSAGYKF